jgi:hypothetical protein
MIGTTLGDIREHIESLASDDGRYYLRCGRFGDRPVPADDLTFQSRAAARAAARATEQYHATLRRYDPQMPFYDVIVCEKPVETAPAPPWEETPDDAGDGDDSPEVGETVAEGIVDFCHTVAGVVFEAIAASSHVGLENAVMETYLETAETIDHPDELCLRLLESIATELDDRLNPAEQATLLRTAASNLPTESVGAGHVGEKPLAGVLGDLQTAGLLDSYRLQPQTGGPSDGVSWRVRLVGYALGRQSRRVVTLPLVVALFDRLATGSVTVTDAELIDEQTWALTVATETTGPPCGLACARPSES